MLVLLLPVAAITAASNHYIYKTGVNADTSTDVAALPADHAADAITSAVLSTP